MPHKLKILIADDHAIVRDGIAAILRFQKDMTLVGEAVDGPTAVQKARELAPDVVMLDLMMPNMDGADATAAILRARPATRILLLTSYGTSSALFRAFKNGATGAITKTEPKEELLAAIRSVAAGVRVTSPEIEQTLNEDATVPELTPRQLEILHSLTRGLTNEDIAKEFGLSKAGVKFHLLTIFRKLDVSNRAEAVGIAARKHIFTFQSKA